ncbi:unnamed protein product [Lathyrus sativus]|nr:unnamed protein product [Lathyrus sativus]
MESSLVLSGAPVNFTYRALQIRTINFSQLLGTGGLGSVYKGSLGDGTSVASLIIVQESPIPNPPVLISTYP